MKKNTLKNTGTQIVIRDMDKRIGKGELDGTESSGDLLTPNYDTIFPVHSVQRCQIQNELRELKS
jgi:hypothetical protein